MLARAGTQSICRRMLGNPHPCTASTKWLEAEEAVMSARSTAMHPTHPHRPPMHPKPAETAASVAHIATLSCLHPARTFRWESESHGTADSTSYVLVKATAAIPSPACTRTELPCRRANTSMPCPCNDNARTGTGAWQPGSCRRSSSLRFEIER